MQKADGSTMSLSDSYRCSLWHGFRRWSANQEAEEMSLAEQMMAIVPARNTKEGFSWRALQNIKEPFLETGRAVVE